MECKHCKYKKECPMQEQVKKTIHKMQRKYGLKFYLHCGLYEVEEDESPKDDTDKTLIIPKETLNKALDTYFKNKNCTIEKVAITQLVNDNDLLNDDDLESYHKKTWNNAKATDLSINENKLNKMSVRDVPYAIKRNGKLIIVDGRHRIRAAYNNGYKFVEIPVVNDEEKFINKKIKIEVK